jgi:REP element-mobilizing transposase RayT
MARALRIEFEDALYHICARGNARAEIFRSDADRSRFLQLLEQSTERFHGTVYCFVLMGNHFHLVVQTPQPNLSRWMHWLIVSYSVYFNRRHHRSGHLFQGRYKSFLVENGEYLLSLSRYIHLNPVRGIRIGYGTPAERRNRLRAFKWSSYQGYAGLTKRFPFVQEESVLGEVARSPRDARVAYRRFVEEGLISQIANPFEAVQWQAALGSERFLQNIRDRVKERYKQRHEMTSLRKAVEFAQPEVVLSRVSRKFKVNPERLTSRGQYGLKAKNVAMWIISERCGIKLREIGALFGGLDYSAVAQRIRRTRCLYSESAAQALIAEMSNV